MLKRKGHIPTILLFILGISLMGIALFLFVSSERSTEGIGGEYDVLSHYIASDRSYVNELFHESVKVSIKQTSGDFESSFLEHFQEVNGNVAEFSKLQGNYFGIIREQDKEHFHFEKGADGVYELRLTGVKLFRKSGESEASAQFDLVERFNEGGIVR